MTVRIYGIQNCDTMKKAFAWLESHQVGYDFHDYKKAGDKTPLDENNAPRLLEKKKLR